MKKLLATAIFSLSLLLTPAALAADYDFLDTINDFQENLQEQSEEIQPGAEAIILPTFEDEAGNQGGAGSIVAALDTLMDFLKLVVAPLAVLLIVIMGVRMVAAGRENEDITTRSKNFIRYALEALFVIFLADTLVNVFFGAEGEIFREGEAGAREFARQAGSLFEGIYSLIQVIIGSVAIFMLVTAGMRYVAGSYSDDQIATAKRQITWSLVGLFIVGVSEFVAKQILFPDEGGDLGIDEAQQLFAQITNFIAGTIGTLSFVALIYAGYLYVTGAANEDNVAKSKKIIIGAVLGILLAFAAFAITSTVITLDAS